MIGVPDWGLASWSWFGYGDWSLIHPWSKFWLSILIFKVQRISMSFNSLLGDLVCKGGFWLCFGILFLIWIWLQVVDTPIFWNLTLCLDFGCVIRTMSFKSCFWALEGARFSRLILVLILSLVFDTPMIRIFALFLDLKVQRTSMSF